MQKQFFTPILTVILMVTLSVTVDAQQWKYSQYLRGNTYSRNLAFAADDVIFCTDQSELIRWNITRESVSTLTATGNIADMAVPVENPFYVAYTDRRNNVVMRYTGDLKLRGSFTMSGGSGDIKKIAVSIDGKRIVTGKDSGGHQGLLNVWDVDSQNARAIKTHIWIGKPMTIDGLAMDTKGHYVFVDYGAKVREIDAKSGKQTHTYTNSSGSFVTAITYGGGYIASGHDNGGVLIWNYNPEGFVRSLRGATDTITSVAFSKNRRYLIAGSEDSKAYVWEVNTGRLLATLKNTSSTVSAVAFSPSGHVAISQGNHIYFWRKTDVQDQPNPELTALNESKSKLNAATLIDGLTINKNDMRQDTDGKNVPIEDTFSYVGNNKFLVLDQGPFNTCGTTSAEMLLHYYGKDVGQGAIWRAGDVHNVEAGSFPAELREALTTLGVPAKWYHRLTLDHLKYYIRHNRPPIILLRWGNFLHYVVVVGYNNNDDFLIADPNGVFRWLTSAELKLGWSLNSPGLPNRFRVKNAFRNFGLRVLTPAVDWLTGGENGIVPLSAPTRHFPANWSDLKTVEVEGDNDWNPLFRTRKWERDLTFNRNFADYRVSNLKPMALSNAFGTSKASVDGHRRSRSTVKVWGKIEYGNNTRGKIWVFVRAYRHNKGDTIAAAPSANQFEDPLEVLPDETSLLPNYPNPFNPETWIPYRLATPADVSVSIYAADGRLVRKLTLGHLPAGIYEGKSHAAYWDGKNSQGEPVASGLYFYTLKAGEFSATRKMLIRK